MRLGQPNRVATGVAQHLAVRSNESVVERMRGLPSELRLMVAADRTIARASPPRLSLYADHAPRVLRFAAGRPVAELVRVRPLSPGGLSA